MLVPKIIGWFTYHPVVEPVPRVIRLVVTVVLVTVTAVANLTIQVEPGTALERVTGVEPLLVAVTVKVVALLMVKI